MAKTTVAASESGIVPETAPNKLNRVDSPLKGPGKDATNYQATGLRPGTRQDLNPGQGVKAKSPSSPTLIRGPIEWGQKVGSADISPINEDPSPGR